MGDSSGGGGGRERERERAEWERERELLLMADAKVKIRSEMAFHCQYLVHGRHSSVAFSTVPVYQSRIRCSETAHKVFLSQPLNGL